MKIIKKLFDMLDEYYVLPDIAGRRVRKWKSLDEDELLRRAQELDVDSLRVNLPYIYAMQALFFLGLLVVFGGVLIRSIFDVPAVLFTLLFLFINVFFWVRETKRALDYSMLQDIGYIGIFRPVLKWKLEYFIRAFLVHR